MLDNFRETAITWDKANRKVYEPLRVSAGDNKGRKLSIQVVNGGVVENLSGASLSLFWETRDKMHKGLDVFTAVDATKGEFEIYYTTGMLSNEGVLKANLVLVDTSGRVVSEPFTITVFKGIDDDAIQSSDSFTALTEALIDVSNLEQNYAPRLNDLTAQLQQKGNQSRTDKLNYSSMNGRNSLKPSLVLSFDDGTIYEFTKTKPLLDSLGVKGIFYHNSSPDFTDRMTDAQIIQLHNEGHEFGSHTRDHVFLDNMGTPGAYTQSATQIQIYNSFPNPMIPVHADHETTLLVCETGADHKREIVRVQNVSTVVEGVLTITLEEPLKNNYSMPYVRFSDEYIEWQLVSDIEFFDRLNIPCKHFSYPFGTSSPEARQIVAKHFDSARKADIIRANFETNGGFVNGSELSLKQFQLNSPDIAAGNQDHINQLLLDAKNRQAFTILLGHAANFESWATQLTDTVNFARSIGLPIMSMDEAMETHGNMIDFDTNFYVSRSGKMVTQKTTHFADVTLQSIELSANGGVVRHQLLNTVDIFGEATNSVVFTVNEFGTEELVLAKNKGVNYTTKVENGILFLVMVNGSGTNYIVPTLTLKVGVFKYV